MPNSSTAKELALQALESLPDDGSLEDAMEKLYFLEKVEKGQKDVENGNVLNHSEVIARFSL